VSGIFTRGRMRLYLLKLLHEQPRHGYDILQLLEERLGGTYAPSPGSVYPRLRRLEADGLVLHDEHGGRKVYRLTSAGQAEVDARAVELAQLDADIKVSVAVLAEEIGEDIRTTARDIDGELDQAARKLHRAAPRAHKYALQFPKAPEFERSGGMIEAQMQVLATRVNDLLDRVAPRSDQVGACAAILDETYYRIARVLLDKERD
jgi:DNA-binding PadR family transcriptional regulator